MLLEKKLIILTTKLLPIFLCFSRIQVLICVLTKHTLNVGGCFILSNVQAHVVIFDLFLIACSLMRDIFLLNTSVLTAVQALTRNILQSNLHHFLSSR